MVFVLKGCAMGSFYSPKRAHSCCPFVLKRCQKLAVYGCIGPGRRATRPSPCAPTLGSDWVTFLVDGHQTDLVHLWIERYVSYHCLARARWKMVVEGSPMHGEGLVIFINKNPT
jgi:hypothetical protein